MNPSILYLSYTGLMEPLGRSQVLAYLSRVSKNNSITLVTFEKPADFSDHTAREALKKECDAHGITWLPRLYHHKPRLLATSWDFLMLLWDTWRLTTRNRTQLVHCRSYIPAIAAWLIGKVTKTPFIFDMRGLWPEELVDAGRLDKKSIIYKAINWLELRLLRDAATVVSVTKAAVIYLKQKYPETSNQHYAVIPTCVDLDRFHTARDRNPERLTIGSMGTILSGWYHIDWLFKLYNQALTQTPDARLKIVTRDNHTTIADVAKNNGTPIENIQFDRASANEVADKISDMSFGSLFFTAGVSKLGSAPTRMAEFLSCGIPVIGNRGVGDMADLIEKYNVGVVIEDGSDSSLTTGISKMMDLLSDETLSQRCRAAAEDYFSADRGAQTFQTIYDRAIKK